MINKVARFEGQYRADIFLFNQQTVFNQHHPALPALKALKAY